MSGKTGETHKKQGNDAEIVTNALKSYQRTLQVTAKISRISRE